VAAIDVDLPTARVNPAGEKWQEEFLREVGKMGSGFPFPEDDYLLALGRIVYAVTYLEWQVLGDLELISGLPEEFKVESLVGKSTGQIGSQLSDEALLAQVADPETRGWLRAGGEHLKQVAVPRNSMLHARPATVDGEPRMYRWDISRGETFTITGAWLEDFLSELDDRSEDMSARRVVSLDR